MVGFDFQGLLMLGPVAGVVAAGGMPAKLVAEKFSNRTNVKSIGFSLGNMKVGGKRDDEEEKNTKTSRIYAWEFII